MMGNGLHLCIDAKATETLTDVAIRHYLENLSVRIGMTPISGPHLYQTPNGWHGHLIIAESHISVETQSLYVFVDIFSCKAFNRATALRVSIDLLGLDVTETIEHPLIYRGWARQVLS